jgi:adenylate cyclase
VGPERIQRKLAALLSADVVGYSRLMAEDDTATIATLRAQRDTMAGLVLQHGGRVVDAVGDNALAEFPSVVDAVACALQIQQHLREANDQLDPARRMEHRMGIHLGDVVVENERLYGDGVNIAARLEPLAEPGGICISGAVHEQVRGRLEIAWEDLGERTLKNIAGPVRVLRARLTAAEAEAATSLTVPGFAGRPAIAVLAFQNMSGDVEQEYFADGIAEDLITRLAAFRQFPVIARNSSFAYKGKSVDVKQVSEELGVRYVIEGSVRKAGDRVRVTAQLIDATSGHHVWAERYDRKLEDIFALQDEIVDMVTAALEPALARAEERRAVAKSPEAYDAWDCVRRGSWHLNRFNKEDTRAGRRWIEKACEIDPTFSEAFGMLALAHLVSLIYQTSDAPLEDLVGSQRAAETCLGLQGEDAMGHFVLGLARSFVGQHDAAIVSCERAVRLNPSYAQAYQALGFSLICAGRPDEGIGMCEKALRLAPQDTFQRPITYFTIGAAHLVADRFAEAVEWARRSREENRQYPPTLRLLAAALGQLGRAEEARAVLDELQVLTPGFSIDTLRLYLPPSLVDRYVEGWRKAGWDG